MLRFHLHRLILASALLLPLIGVGIALSPSQMAAQAADSSSDSGHAEVAPAWATQDTPARQGHPSHPVRPSKRQQWTFFSFGRRGAY